MVVVFECFVGLLGFFVVVGDFNELVDGVVYCVFVVFLCVVIGD